MITQALAIKHSIPEDQLDKWEDITSELWREYHFIDIDPGGTYHIHEPELISIAPSSMGGHSHRIINSRGISHYVHLPPSGVVVTWESKRGKPPFMFFKPATAADE